MTNRFDLKIITIAVLTLALLLAVVLLRPVYKTGVPEPIFMNQKLSKANSHDIVFAGDSRTLRAISPQHFVGTDKLRVHNFGFRSAAINKPYLEAAVDLLDASSDLRVLVLGVTPNAFTPKSASDNGFDNAVKESKNFSSMTPRWWYSLERQLSPMSLTELMNILKRKTKNGVFEVHCADGWIASDRNPINEETALPLYRVRFDNNQASQEIIGESLEFVELAVNQGITVVGFCPPVTEEMRSIEDQKSGFDYADYISRFRSCGGIWVEPDTKGLKTYDGSHLSSESAKVLSSRIRDSLDSILTRNQ